MGLLSRMEYPKDEGGMIADLSQRTRRLPLCLMNHMIYNIAVELVEAFRGQQVIVRTPGRLRPDVTPGCG